LEEFVMVAGAHFLALLSPGPDFFLIVRYALVAGPRSAVGVCLGVALAHAGFVALALSGFAVLNPEGALFAVVRWAGVAYLFYMGVGLIRGAGAPRTLGAHRVDGMEAAAPVAGLLRGAVPGFVTAILNPKNALFYASLFTVLAAAGTPGPARLGYGVWMVLVVVSWDLLVARLATRPRWVAWLSRHLASVERVAGLALLLLALGLAMDGPGAP
tara:strand:- start:50 stop:691 length:642 start_codon:yes stop_codon:yes gene_type:complete